jgi:hypothetical protein
MALLVAVTLTMICQGHDLGGYHTGPHLTFMGELGHEHSVAEQSAIMDDGFDPVDFDALDALDPTGAMDMAGMDMTAAEMHAMHMPGADANSQGLRQLSTLPTQATNSAGANLASVVSSSGAETMSLSMLSFLLLVSLLWRDSRFSALDMAGVIRRKSQTAMTAEPPPPRSL